VSWSDVRDLDLRDVNFSGVGDWPIVGKATVAAIVLVLVLVIGYFLAVSPKLDTLHQAQAQEMTLRHTFAKKARLAANLEAYQTQLATMRKRFGTLLRQLPSETEIDDLLANVSQTARGDGLTQTLFQPKKEIAKDFYAEKPIQMAYIGSWPQIAKFVSDVAALPRIVTFQNFSLKPRPKSGGSQLDFSVTGLTYRYLSGDKTGKHKGKKR
jgi:type IV pilus assembly protein PilO